ncbi:hypothetical protein [Azospirillum sp. ST 5-10]|uniref:hypothetical protein n=1 Tax=unclassified Azospirillum TaxID=2630922 RepID=UPI003F49B924
MDHQRAPSLSEMLDDPIVVAVMRRDGVSREQVQAVIEQVRRNLRAQRALRERLAA